MQTLLADRRQADPTELACRGISKVYERNLKPSQAMIQISMIAAMLKRLENA